MARQAGTRKRQRAALGEEMSAKESRPRHDQRRTASASSFLDLFTEQDPLSRVPRELAQYLDIQDIINLTKTCKVVSSLYQKLLPTHWSIHSHLNRFVKDLLKLQETLRVCDALISGSVALQYFERATWPESDLNVYVHQDRVEPLLNYLVRQEGYSFVGHQDFDEYEAVEVDEVRIFKRKSPSGVVSEVQVILTSGPPVVSIISGFYMTAVVNIISHNRAFAIFPRQTFIEKKSFLMRDLDEQVSELLQKYKRRGWTTEDPQKSQLDPTWKRAIEGDRWIGDKKCWTIELEPQVSVNGSNADTVLESRNFWVSGSSIQTPSLCHLDIRCIEMEHPLLRDQYTYGNLAWPTYLKTQLDLAASILAVKTKAGGKYLDAIVPSVQSAFIDEESERMRNKEKEKQKTTKSKSKSKGKTIGGS